jgi:hypothetical protein
MQVHQTEGLPEVLIIEPRVFGDDRGFFYESFNQRRFQELTGVSPSLCRTITPAPQGMYCAGCIIRFGNRRASWCGLWQERYSTWQST